jgi:hypothetical protein
MFGHGKTTFTDMIGEDFIRDILTKDGMTTFMDDGIHVGDEVCLKVFGGDSDIVLTKLFGEWMFGGGDGTSVEVKAVEF